MHWFFSQGGNWQSIYCNVEVKKLLFEFLLTPNQYVSKDHIKDVISEPLIKSFLIAFVSLSVFNQSFPFFFSCLKIFQKYFYHRTLMFYSYLIQAIVKYVTIIVSIEMSNE